jgi:DNA-binding PadR family transcriptional regulator
METRGYLASREEAEGRTGRPRRIYTATKAGKKALAVARRQLRELVGEVSECQKPEP